MATITKPNTFSAGAVIVAAEHNDNADTIFNDYNGNITNANIAAAAAIAGSKLDLTTVGAIGSTSASTGKFTTLIVGTANIGDIYYDDGTDIDRITPSTHGTVLICQGAAKPVWGYPTSGNSLIKGWFNLNGTGTIALRDSFNVSSVADFGAGNYGIYWDNDFANSYHSLVMTADESGGYSTHIRSPMSTNSANIISTSSTEDAADTYIMNGIVIGELA